MSNSRRTAIVALCALLLAGAGVVYWFADSGDLRVQLASGQRAGHPLESGLPATREPESRPSGDSAGKRGGQRLESRGEALPPVIDAGSFAEATVDAATESAGPDDTSQQSLKGADWGSCYDFFLNLPENCSSVSLERCLLAVPDVAADQRPKVEKLELKDCFYGDLRNVDKRFFLSPETDLKDLWRRIRERFPNIRHVTVLNDFDPRSATVRFDHPSKKPAFVTLVDGPALKQVCMLPLESLVLRGQSIGDFSGLGNCSRTLTTLRVDSYGNYDIENVTSNVMQCRELEVLFLEHMTQDIREFSIITTALPRLRETNLKRPGEVDVD